MHYRSRGIFDTDLLARRRQWVLCERFYCLRRHDLYRDRARVATAFPSSRVRAVYRETEKERESERDREKEKKKKYRAQKTRDNYIRVVFGIFYCTVFYICNGRANTLPYRRDIEIGERDVFFSVGFSVPSRTRILKYDDPM